MARKVLCDRCGAASEFAVDSTEMYSSRWVNVNVWDGTFSGSKDYCGVPCAIHALQDIMPKAVVDPQACTEAPFGASPVEAEVTL